MAAQTDLERWRKGLQANMPFVGRRRRRAAMTELEAARHRPEAVPLLAEALGNSDGEIAARAEAALRDLKPRSPSVNALCDLAMSEPVDALAKLCREQNYRPRDDEHAALFLFVTRQLDLYFQEYEADHFDALRREYDRANQRIRDSVMEVVRSGDVRCLPFIQRPRKTLRESSESEIKLAIQSCLRHQDWSGLFRLCLELPVKYGFPALAHFRDAGWEPEKAELKSLFRQLLADSAGETIEPPPPPKAGSSVFERWIEQGRSGELSRLSEGELAARLKSGSPPDGAAVVSALAGKPSLSRTTIEAVARSEHWLVRLAGLATGLTKEIVMGIVKDTPEDANYWVNELAGAPGVLELWPTSGTQKDLERFDQAPAAAFAGKLGAVRRVLRDIIAYHRGGDVIIEPVVLNISETEVEIVVEKN